MPRTEGPKTTTRPVRIDASLLDELRLIAVTQHQPISALIQEMWTLYKDHHPEVQTTLDIVKERGKQREK